MIRLRRRSGVGDHAGAPEEEQEQEAGEREPPVPQSVGAGASRSKSGGSPSPSPSSSSSSSLLRWDEVPEEFVECFILSGYRRLPCSAQECVASALRPTNETLNFWTHFVPLLLFAAQFGRLAFEAARLPRAPPGALLPLWCYASGVLLTLAMSCAAHLFGCLSPRLRAAFFYLDYASISYYGFASTVAYYHYLLPGLRLLRPRDLGPLLRRSLGWDPEPFLPALLEAYLALVLPLALVLALGCTVACCRSRRRGCPYPFAVRTFVFAAPLSMACPIALESLLFDLRRRRPALFRRFCRRYAWLLAAAFFNVSKIPERIRPGRFDIVGHSHQLFHLFTSLSIYDQSLYVEEGLREFLQRDVVGKDAASLPTWSGTVGYMLLLVLCLALVLRRFLNLPAQKEQRGLRSPSFKAGNVVP